MPGQVTFHTAERISIEGNHFTHLGGLALVLSRAGSNNTVRGNVIDDVSGGGVEVRGPGGGNRVEDNWVHHIGIDYRSSVGIALEGSPGATVTHTRSTTCRTRESGASPRAACTWRTNLVFNAPGTVPDGGGIYLPFAQAHPSTTEPWCAATWCTTRAAPASTPTWAPTGSATRCCRAPIRQRPAAATPPAPTSWPQQVRGSMERAVWMPRLPAGETADVLAHPRSAELRKLPAGATEPPAPEEEQASARAGNRFAQVAQGLREMELVGLEPTTSWVRSRRSPN